MCLKQSFQSFKNSSLERVPIFVIVINLGKGVYECGVKNKIKENQWLVLIIIDEKVKCKTKHIPKNNLIISLWH